MAANQLSAASNLSSRSKATSVTLTNSNDPLEEEVTNTMNFSRTGLCFTTLLTHYCEGMLVTVTVPYSSAVQVRKNYLGKIVRLDHLSNGCMAVAVQFLS